MDDVIVSEAVEIAREEVVDDVESLIAALTKLKAMAPADEEIRVLVDCDDDQGYPVGGLASISFAALESLDMFEPAEGISSKEYRIRLF